MLTSIHWREKPKTTCNDSEQSNKKEKRKYQTILKRAVTFIYHQVALYFALSNQSREDDNLRR